jgi:hypothetical protein
LLVLILEVFKIFLQKILSVKINSIFLFVLFFVSKVAFGQSVIKKISGRITAELASVEAINIENTSNKGIVISDKKGVFSLDVSEGDILIFSAVNLETLRMKITKSDLNSSFIKVEMIPKSIFLREVIVKKSEITAESLGIISHNIKRYTPAERKLYTATSTSLDALLNAISGRTAMLKKGIIVEKKEMLLAKIEYLFEEKYYTQTLKIPEDYIRGFQYYCIDDVDFVKALQSKNKTLIMFLIVPLAQKYLDIIAKEK